MPMLGWGRPPAIPEPEPGDDEPSEDERVFFHRWWSLMQAGAELEPAGHLAAARDVDLHQACDLVEKAGQEMALRILL